MTIRQTTIAKLQQLPDSLLQEVDDFIDFITRKHQSKITNVAPQNNTDVVWERWFESVDRIEIETTEPVSEYQKLILDKYRQQGLNL
jgi:hypothetical protein